MIVQSYAFARRIKSQFFYVQCIYKEPDPLDAGGWLFVEIWSGGGIRIDLRLESFAFSVFPPPLSSTSRHRIPQSPRGGGTRFVEETEERRSEKNRQTPR